VCFRALALAMATSSIFTSPSISLSSLNSSSELSLTRLWSGPSVAACRLATLSCSGVGNEDHGLGGAQARGILVLLWRTACGDELGLGSILWLQEAGESEGSFFASLSLIYPLITCTNKRVACGCVTLTIARI
jgi:hypothetical protein